MPFENEHACRLRDPDDFQENSFRRMDRKTEDGKTYAVIMGRLTGEDTMTDQAYRYPIETWTESEARSHCKAHDGILFEPASGSEDTNTAAENSDCCNGGKMKTKNITRQPIRCFEGNAKPHEPFWKWWLSLESDEGEPAEEIEPDPEIPQDIGTEPELEIYGYISEYSWYEDDVTPKMFKNDLYLYGQGKPITVRLNSGGGDLIAASVIKSTLMDYPGRVTVKIDGLAASAATLVALAGDRIWMNESAYFMIHDPLIAFFLAVLDIDELSQLLDSLKTAKSGILDAYQTRTGMGRTELAHMMSAETWMTAAEAVENKFADKVLKVKKNKLQQQAKGLQNAAIINSLRNYVNVPAELRATAPLQSGPVFNKAAERLRAEVKLYKK